MEAYHYAAGNVINGEPSPKPFELFLLGYIDRFGVQAVMGRPVLSAGEIRRMIAVENIVNAYRSRKASDNWAEWANKNKNYNAILIDIETTLHEH